MRRLEGYTGLIEFESPMFQGGLTESFRNPDRVAQFVPCRRRRRETGGTEEFP